LPFSCSSVWSVPPPARSGFSFECCSLSHMISTRIHHFHCFGRLACLSAPTLSLCASPNLCKVLAAPLGGWLFTLPLLSAFASLPTLDHWEFGSLPHSHSLRQVQGSTPNSAVSVTLWLFMGWTLSI
jgi:hypothetical protein